MLIIFTGDGKGKTTAALGQAVRAVGRGKQVLMIQFIKGPWKSGEDFIELVRKEKKDGRFELRKRGKGFVGILGDKLPKEEHERAAKEALAEFKAELATEMWHVIILDEVNVATSLGLLSPGEVLDAVRAVPENRLLIMTGRGAPPEFIEQADLVTEMKDIKHPYHDGTKGSTMVEY